MPPRARFATLASLATMLACLVATPAFADPALAQDPGASPPGTVRAGPATATLANAEPFFGDPFEPSGLRDAWHPPVPSAGNVPFPPPSPRFFAPQLTLRLRPVLGIEPFVNAHGFSGQGRLALGNEFGFRYVAGRLQMGARFQLLRDRGALALGATTYVRYVAPT
jgi:hypothetical protein